MPTWKTDTQLRSGAGLILNATTCQVTAGKARTLPELHGTSQIQLDLPPLYTPEELQIVNEHELPEIKTAFSFLLLHRAFSYSLFNKTNLCTIIIKHTKTLSLLTV
jgi:hypothetical protein